MNIRAAVPTSAITPVAKFLLWLATLLIAGTLGWSRLNARVDAHDVKIEEQGTAIHDLQSTKADQKDIDKVTQHIDDLATGLNQRLDDMKNERRGYVRDSSHR